MNTDWLIIKGLDEKQGQLDDVFCYLLGLSSGPHTIMDQLTPEQREAARHAADRLWETMGEIRRLRHALWEKRYWESCEPHEHKGAP